mmetsp:Transcript_16136/g.26218  ORF Transcript_16136/g.26218 Transcript_16136/m.26218 type:complete len:205 (+) Transcript_16136:1924-2538(+)
MNKRQVRSLTFKNTAINQSSWPLIVSKHLLLVVKDNLVWERVQEARQYSLVIFIGSNVNKVQHFDQFSWISSHKTCIQIHISILLSSQVERQIFHENLPVLDILVRIPKAVFVSGRTGTLCTLLENRIEVFTWTCVGHRRHATLSFGGHNNSVRRVFGKTFVCFHEVIHSKGSKGFVVWDVESDIASVCKNHQLLFVHQLKQRP